ncbi:cytochrome-c oxidase, cbb3-type subunit III [Sinorhizobium meliloti]|uniref:Cbb3-type cytochrome c oxidase subunit n=1 Tax=Rhizobium meliloti (strain 1021) TaxID=266834 RepID=Q92ZX5_RHIME|nr:cytochrome-c oxidase, cbb3-type subunit III [Sinorhizobium meliloti]TWB25501.1 cytochrome c oxidase cbb3-type subunit 3 [Ensifer sp. SEMIA 135]AAK64981.1 FixP3 Diheme c-type cytochrome [Sinorhizobium meliloti 1021]AEG06955.1 cytochrome c oxidase, cbb3-type, subunit III [Sinorhizobium meliloti BL225C]AGG70011.1 FixP3 Diheme c-type cytochrome [Sinorhizobium meliloti 2011]AIM02325.1 cytochrome C [Sinorhizobium meliloti]
MDVEEVDPISGRRTTGHEWNGIKELDTPVPRGVLLFLVVTHVFALLWWVLLPTWPLGTTYTKGLLGIDERNVVEEKLAAAAAARAVWEKRIDTLSYEQIRADEQLMATVRSTGHQLFGDNCAVCHGIDGKGRSNYPDLTDDDWLWGGGPEDIEQTLRVGINTRHPESRVAQMPSFGREQMLERNQVRDVAAYVYSLTNPGYSTPENIGRIEAGREVFLTSCAACHGENARGSREVGAPNLTDAYWIYGGTMQTIIESVHGGRQGHMPTWDERLTSAEIKILALYINSLGVEKP